MAPVQASDPTASTTIDGAFAGSGTTSIDTNTSTDLANTTALPVWTTNVQDGGHTLPFTAVGVNPFVAEKHAAVTVPVAIIPLILDFPSGDVFDPTVGGACDSKSPVDRVMASPLFTESDWTWGGTDVGNTQYIDAFQRAEFWQYTSPQGINPNYHVHFAAKLHDPITWDVPDPHSPYWDENPQEYVKQCADGTPVTVGSIFYIAFQDELRTLVNNLEESGVVPPGTLPVLLTTNVTASAAEGWHIAILDNYQRPLWTYIWSTYNTTPAFGFPDTTVLAHELAEWTNNPFNDSYWLSEGYYFFPTEVADWSQEEPLTTVVSHGFTYHLPELTYFSWFYHQTPSIGLNGWYSNFGTFTSPGP